MPIATANFLDGRRISGGFFNFAAKLVFERH
jgi:hypothetical protein